MRWLVVIAVLACARIAAAQEPEIELEEDKQPAEPIKDPKMVKKWLAAAQQLIAKGDALVKQGKADEAKDQFTNARLAYEKGIEAGGDASIYVSLIAVDEKLGDVAAAYDHAKKAVDPAAGLKPDVVKKAQTKLDELATKVAVVKLVITPEGTQVSIDRKSVGESPLAQPVVLAPGTYTMSLVAVGYQPKDVELKVDAGAELERNVELDPVPVKVTPMEPEDKPVPLKKPDMLPLYIGAGATAGFLLLGTITGIEAIAQHNAYTARVATASERADARSSGLNFAHATDALIVGTLGAAAFTGYWYWYKWRPAHEKYERQPKVSVAPWVRINGGGVTAAGSF